MKQIEQKQARTREKRNKITKSLRHQKEKKESIIQLLQISIFFIVSRMYGYKTILFRIKIYVIIFFRLEIVRFFHIVKMNLYNEASGTESRDTQEVKIVVSKRHNTKIQANVSYTKQNSFDSNYIEKIEQQDFLTFLCVCILSPLFHFFKIQDREYEEIIL